MKWLAIACAMGVAVCWGLYGPTLSNARSPMKEWSPFKPYIFIGLAYLVIAIIGGSLAMRFVFQDSFDFTGTHSPAMKWGFLAGCLGAFGALALTFALTKAGGKPAYVMPIVFGGAVTVNGLFAFFSLTNRTEVSPLLWIGMSLVVIGIVITAAHTPHEEPKRAVEDSTNEVALSLTSEGIKRVKGSVEHTEPGGENPDVK